MNPEKLTPKEKEEIYTEIFEEMATIVRGQAYPYIPYIDGKKVEASMKKLKELLELVV